MTVHKIINENLVGEPSLRLYDDFTLLGCDVEACDVSYAEVAQTEVVTAASNPTQL